MRLSVMYEMLYDAPQWDRKGEQDKQSPDEPLYNLYISLMIHKLNDHQRKSNDKYNDVGDNDQGSNPTPPLV